MCECVTFRAFDLDEALNDGEAFSLTKPRMASRWASSPSPSGPAASIGVPRPAQASCGLAIVTTVAAVGLSLKQGSSVQRDWGRSL